MSVHLPPRRITKVPLALRPRSLANRTLFVLALLIADPAAPVTEAAEAGGPVSVADLVATTLSANPEIRFYSAEIAAAEGGRRQAGRWADPEVSAQLGHQHLGGVGDGVAWSVTLVQPFEWPGRIGLRKAIANCDVELARLGLERFRSALAAKVRSLAYGLIAARARAAAADEVDDRFRALREVLVARDPAGVAPLLETRVIEAAALLAAQRATDARAELEAAHIDLNRLRGLPPDAPLELRSTQVRLGPCGELADLFAGARTNNFEVRLREVELAQQGLRVDLARHERYPTIGLGPNLQETGADQQRIIGVAVSLPLPLWNRNGQAVATEGMRQAQAEAAMAATLREVESQVTRAATTYRAKRTALDRWRPDAMDHFRAAARLADEHYRLGAVPVATYVELQRQYVDAVEAVLQTRQQAIEAGTQIEALVGSDLALVTESASNEGERSR